jgi:deoxyribonuclease-1-like protein
MNKLFSILFLLFCSASFSQTKLLSWNLENFGKSKSKTEIAFVAETVREYDIIAIQEVVAGYGGVQAVAKLAAELNRKGAKWNYVISEPTSGSPYQKERYAFIWKTTKLKKIGSAWLEKTFHLEIEREPFYCTFQYNNKQFTVVNFHAVPKSKQPEREIKYFKKLADEYSTLNLIFVGDFNCPQSHNVFNPLKKMGYKSILTKQKTSLKQKCKNNECLASEYDNMFYQNTKTRNLSSGIISFYKKFYSLKEARKISDHIPLWFEFSLN